MKTDIVEKLIVIILTLITAYAIGFFTILIGHEELRWIFSATAQSISAMVAFLLAGYALFIGELNKQEERDPSCEEIIHRMKTGFFDKLRTIFWLAFLSIGFSLVSIIFAKEIRTWAGAYIHGVTFILILFTLLSICLFVTPLIDPYRINNIANQMFYERKRKIEGEKGETDDPKPSKEEGENNISKFLTKFKYLENLLSEFNGIDGRVKSFPSSVIAKKALEKGIFTKDFYAKLRGVIMFRNLLLHSDVNEVSPQEINLLDETIAEIKRILSSNSLFPSPIEIISEDEYIDILNSEKNMELKIMFMFGFESGLSLNEIKNLGKNDISISRKQVSIKNSKRKTLRIVPLPQSFRNHMLKYVPFNTLDKKTRKSFLIACGRVGIIAKKPKISFGSLRKGFIYKCLLDGIGANKIVEMAGLESISGLNYYIRRIPKEIATRKALMEYQNKFGGNTSFYGE